MPDGSGRYRCPRPPIGRSARRLLVAMASSTFRRLARRAGQMAANTPTSAASSTRMISVPTGTVVRRDDALGQGRR